MRSYVPFTCGPQESADIGIEPCEERNRSLTPWRLHMKLKALLAALAVAGLTASFGITGAGFGSDGTTGSTTGQTTTTSEEHCHGVEVSGTIASISATSLTVTVKHANRGGAALGSTATFTVGPKTRVFWHGVGTLTGPNQGDQVAVVAKGSCTSSSTTAPASLTAFVVIARTPRTDAGDQASTQGGDSQHSKRH
jgi:hypothetical protein